MAPGISDFSTCSILISEPSDGMVTVPNLYGKTLEEAKSALKGTGLYIEMSGALPTSSSIVVFTQSTPAGSEVKYGSVITVTLIDKSKIGMY